MTKVTSLFGSDKSDILNAAVITITPQLARQWLDSTDNSIQRRLSLPHVVYLAKEMKNGHWDLNGQPIQIDKNGNVVNGQHRLNACIESGCNFQSLVVFNVETSAIKTIDEGAKARGISDFLDIRYNAKYSIPAAAAIRMIVFWDSGWRKTLGRGGTSMKNSSTSLKLSPAEAEAFIKDNPGFFEFIAEASSLHQAGENIVPKSLFCGLLWLVERENPVHARAFFAKLAIGADIPMTSPVLYLRNWLREHKGGYKYSRGLQIGMIIKCFNYYAKGVEVVKRIEVPKEVPDIIPAKKA
jgi:hypothetical protein